MITVCPKCELALAVSAADLRTAGGHVRCGRCAAVFNALAALYDESTLSETARGRRIALDFELPPEPPPEPPPVPQPPTPLAPEQAPSHASRPVPPPLSAAQAPDLGEQTMEADDLATLIARPRPAPAAVDVGDDADVAPIPIEDDADLEVLVIPSTPERTPEPAGAGPAPPRPEPPPQEPPGQALAWLVEADNTAAAATPAAPAAPAETAPAAEETEAAAPPAIGAGAMSGLPGPSQLREPPEGPSRSDQPASAGSVAAEEFIAEVAQRDEPAAARDVAWRLAAGVLALTLLLQVGHRYRAELAALPALERAVTGLYAALGSPVVPHWSLGAYEVQQNGAFADAAAGGVLEVRASIRNRGDRPQPAPLLRVVLEDRFANRIAARDVEPAEYLARAGGAPAAVVAPRIAPGRRLDATIALGDPGGNAVGFEIDVCLRRTGGAVACANDAVDARP